MKHYQGAQTVQIFVFRRKAKLRSRTIYIFWHKTIRTYFQNFIWIIAYKIYVEQNRSRTNFYFPLCINIIQKHPLKSYICQVKAFPISLEGPSLNFATLRLTWSCSETLLTLLTFDGISSYVGSCASYIALKGL